MAGLNAAAERGHCRDLALGKVGITVLVTGIGDLDSDRAGIDVGFARPEGSAGMPGATALLNQLDDAAVFEHEVMGRHLAPRRAQEFQRAAASGIPV